jgi:hypothetical protein
MDDYVEDWNVILRDYRAQFHQRSMCSFYVCTLRSQLFCTFILGLYFTGAKAGPRLMMKLNPGVNFINILLVQKLPVDLC